MVQLRRFVGGGAGEWDVVGCTPVVGEGLATPARLAVEHLDVPVTGPASAGPEAAGRDPAQDGATWILRGTDSNLRYTTAVERDSLRAASPPLGRPGSTLAALIPISKSAAWWELAQDERREVMEEQSHHIATGLTYTPAVARQLSHGRDLGEPFDFLTWFEYAPSDAGAFEELVGVLRSSPEWSYVDREVDVRLARR